MEIENCINNQNENHQKMELTYKKDDHYKLHNIRCGRPRKCQIEQKNTISSYENI